MADTLPPCDPPTPARLRHVRGPAGLIDSYRIARRNILELIPEEAFEEPVVSGAGATRFHFVMEPEAIRRVLQTRAEDYPKSTLARAVLEPAIGTSMIVAESEDWRRQRRAAAPAFQPRHVDGLGPVMSAAAARAADRLEASSGRAANLLDEMAAATFEVIADATFSGGPAIDRDSVHRAIEAYGMAAARMSFLDLVGAPAWVPRPARLRPAPEMAAMKALADRVIAERRTRPAKTPPDLLDLLVGAEELDDRDVRDNLLAFIVAGHETTALTLAWAFYLLGLDPEVQEAVRQEARAALGDRVAGPQDLPRLPLTRQVIDETLRLYPPAGFLSRMAAEPDELCGAQVVPGDTVTIPVYAVHRHRALWAEPDMFRPGRFAEPKAIPRYAYLPFGDGPRICIGARFALQEAVIILATLVARFRTTPIPGKTPTPTLIITLRPEPGVWQQIERV